MKKTLLTLVLTLVATVTFAASSLNIKEDVKITKINNSEIGINVDNLEDLNCLVEITVTTTVTTSAGTSSYTQSWLVRCSEVDSFLAKR